MGQQKSKSVLEELDYWCGGRGVRGRLLVVGLKRGVMWEGEGVISDIRVEKMGGR